MHFGCTCNAPSDYKMAMQLEAHINKQMSEQVSQMIEQVGPGVFTELFCEAHIPEDSIISPENLLSEITDDEGREELEKLYSRMLKAFRLKFYHLYMRRFPPRVLSKCIGSKVGRDVSDNVIRRIKNRVVYRMGEEWTTRPMFVLEELVPSEGEVACLMGECDFTCEGRDNMIKHFYAEHPDNIKQFSHDGTDFESKHNPDHTKDESHLPSLAEIDSVMEFIQTQQVDDGDELKKRMDNLQFVKGEIGENFISEFLEASPPRANIKDTSLRGLHETSPKSDLIENRDSRQGKPEDTEGDLDDLLDEFAMKDPPSKGQSDSGDKNH